MSPKPSLSVVLPYYRNARTLVRCIESFVRQEGVPPDSIIVVDDGAESEAQALVEAHRWPLPIKVLRSARRGQSYATNLGIAATQSDLVLLTCADMVASPTLVAEHIKAHGTEAHVGVMGHIAYAPWITMTPLMAYLALPKVQFDFESIVDCEDAPPQLLYAPNVSLKRQSLVDVGMFDEALTYGYQDCDLGLRLAQMGTRFVYNCRAQALHDHPNTVAGFVHRQKAVNALWPPMAKRPPRLANVSYMSQCLDHFGPMMSELPRLQALAEQCDTGVVDPKKARTLDLTRRFTLFGLLGSVAMMQGIVSNLEGLRQVMDVRGRPWLASKTTAQGATSPSAC